MAKQKLLISGNKLSEISNYKDLVFMSWNEDKKTGEIVQNDKGLFTVNLLSMENETTIAVKIRQNPVSMGIKKGDSVDVIGNITIVPYAGQINGNYVAIEHSITCDRLEKNSVAKTESK